MYLNKMAARLPCPFQWLVVRLMQQAENERPHAELSK